VTVAGAARAEAGRGLEAVRAAGLDGLVRRGTDPRTDELAAQRVLPVLPELRDVLPGGGLRRGTTIALTATSLLLALLAAASRRGSWCAVVGLPTLGVGAAAELGVALDRLALVPNPGPDWSTVVAALLDGVDVVVAAPPGAVTAAVTRRLAARARQRGSVLVSVGRWDGADLTLDAEAGAWRGLGRGRGRLQGREVTVVARGRGAASAPRRTRVWLPRPAGLYAELLARGVPETALTGPVGTGDGPAAAGARPPLTVVRG
jgi:hypothetical protein